MLHNLSERMERNMICSERERLKEYFVCVERFRDVVLALKNLNGGEFDLAYGKSEKCRISVDTARLALEQHRMEHSC